MSVYHRVLCHSLKFVSHYSLFMARQSLLLNLEKEKKIFNLGSEILGSPPSFYHHLSTSVICLMFKERDLPDVLLDHTTLACRSCPILTATVESLLTFGLTIGVQIGL